MGKRTLDIVLTLLVGPFAVVVTAVFAAALAIEMRGNPFFVQTRIGLNGRPFRMYKLRTMHHLAPGQKTVYRVEDWETYVFSPPGVPDPRVTRLGQFCRDTSIDELPNLLNVLMGDMSLVGPRPEIPDLVSQYPAAYHRRHEVRPGIAGLAQCSGRSDLTYAETLTYDLAYVEDHSVLTDIHILWRTLIAVVKGSGAR